VTQITYKRTCDFCKARSRWSFREDGEMKACCGKHAPKYGLPKVK
jgi:hypothetical protein